MILVGHVTKQGSIAGPKLLEHIVDVVLSIEGDKYQDLRVLRSTKNRYGSTNESVIYEMSDSGMKIVQNPSSNLLSERTNVDGSVILASMDGNRPLLIEVQALVNPTNFGYPKRTASGFDLNRLNLLCAVLQRRTKLNLDSHDIYVNIVGGFRIDDPGADMAVCMAIASAAKSLALDDNVAVFGEIGLGGELRSVRGLEKRIAEAKKLGYTKIIGPKLSKKAPAGYNPIPEVRSALNTYLK
jgi:DNA repair protein RadA/Sms